MKCGQSVSGSVYNHDCNREALFFVLPTEWDGKGGKKPIKPTDMSLYGLKQTTYCKVHRGAVLRRRWGDQNEASFLPIDGPEAKPYLDRLAVLRAEHNAEVAAENAKKAAEAEARSKANSKAEWAGYDAAVVLTATEEHEDRYSSDWMHHEFKWSTTPQTPRGRYDEFSVEVVYNDIRADEEWQDIDPAYVRLRQTGNLTPAQARAVAESLLLAARKAEEVTAQRYAVREARLEPKTAQ